MYTPADLEKAGSFVVFGHSTTGAMAASPIEQLLQKVESMNGFATWATPQISAIYSAAFFPPKNITQRFQGNIDLGQLTEHNKKIDCRVKAPAIQAERMALRDRVKVAAYFICRSALKDPVADDGRALAKAGVRLGADALDMVLVQKRPKISPSTSRVAAKSSTRTMRVGYSSEVILDQIEARDDFNLWESAHSDEELAMFATKFPEATKMRMCDDADKKSLQTVNDNLKHSIAKGKEGSMAQSRNLALLARATVCANFMVRGRAESSKKLRGAFELIGAALDEQAAVDTKEYQEFLQWRKQRALTKITHVNEEIATMDPSECEAAPSNIETIDGPDSSSSGSSDSEKTDDSDSSSSSDEDGPDPLLQQVEELERKATEVAEKFEMLVEKRCEEAAEEAAAEEAAAEEAAELDAFETGMADIVESESEISSDSDSD
jgi:hypothetical protein